MLSCSVPNQTLITAWYRRDTKNMAATLQSIPNLSKWLPAIQATLLLDYGVLSALKAMRLPTYPSNATAGQLVLLSSKLRGASLALPFIVVSKNFKRRNIWSPMDQTLSRSMSGRLVLTKARKKWKKMSNFLTQSRNQARPKMRLPVSFWHTSVPF